MSCLIHALIPLSRLKQDNYTNADGNGGHEMGTWTFGPYFEVFDKACGHSIPMAKRRTLVANGCAGICHEFTPQEQKAIARYIRTRISQFTRIRHGKAFVILMDDRKNEHYPFSGRLVITLRWTRQLARMFERGKRVVWYTEVPEYNHGKSGLESEFKW